MSEPFVGEIRMCGFNFAPKGWAVCNGQLIPISQNTALFSLLGTFYGGDGRSTFALPDLRGRTPIGQGQGAGLTDRIIGETGGEDSVTLLASELAAHAHVPLGSTAAATATAPGGYPGAAAGSPPYATLPAADTSAAGRGVPAARFVGLAGGNLPHENRPPFLTVNFIIALTGVFPPRS